MQEKLAPYNVRILEEGLCGRTTIYEDLYRENRNGLRSLPEILETSYPIDGAVIMLGTNDCKSCYKSNPYKIAKGIGMCVDECLKYVTPDKILIISPIYLGNEVWKSEFDPEFDKNSVTTAKQLYREYKKVAREKGTNVISAADYAQPSDADREHLTVEGHKVMAEAVFNTLLSTKMV